MTAMVFRPMTAEEIAERDEAREAARERLSFDHGEVFYQARAAAVLDAMSEPSELWDLVSMMWKAGYMIVPLDEVKPRDLSERGRVDYPHPRTVSRTIAHFVTAAIISRSYSLSEQERLDIRHLVETGAVRPKDVTPQMRHVVESDDV